MTVFSWCSPLKNNAYFPISSSRPATKNTEGNRGKRSLIQNFTQACFPKMRNRPRIISSIKRSCLPACISVESTLTGCHILTRTYEIRSVSFHAKLITIARGLYSAVYESFTDTHTLTILIHRCGNIVTTRPPFPAHSYFVLAINKVLQIYTHIYFVRQNIELLLFIWTPNSIHPTRNIVKYTSWPFFEASCTVL
jgi:hypothetical protein